MLFGAEASLAVYHPSEKNPTKTSRALSPAEDCIRKRCACACRTGRGSFVLIHNGKKVIAQQRQKGAEGSRQSHFPTSVFRFVLLALTIAI